MAQGPVLLEPPHPVVRIRVKREMSTCPIRASNSVTMFVTSRRYCHANSAQAVKEADRFTRPIPRIHAHTQGCYKGVTTMYRCPGVARADVSLRLWLGLGLLLHCCIWFRELKLISLNVSSICLQSCLFDFETRLKSGLRRSNRAWARYSTTRKALPTSIPKLTPY